MLVLDTDHVSLLDWGTGAEYASLRARLAGAAPRQIATTIVTFEEQSRGWLATTARAQTRSRSYQLDAYARLLTHLENYRLRRVMPFDEKASDEFERLRLARIRVGTMDLRIASIALAHGATLLSRNLIDFRRVPGLDVQDWISLPP